LLDRFDLAGAPGLVEEGWQWVVEPKDREEAFAGDRLEPVAGSLFTRFGEFVDVD
jgi:hypothetical protein